MDAREAYIRSAGTVKDAVLQLLETLDEEDTIYLLWNAAETLLNTQERLKLVRLVLLSALADSIANRELWEELEKLYTQVHLVSQNITSGQ